MQEGLSCANSTAGLIGVEILLRKGRKLLDRGTNLFAGGIMGRRKRWTIEQKER